MDNALPHMLTDADLAMALRAMCSKVRARGVLVISVRDYDRAMIDRPATALPLVHRGPPRQVVVRLHDWDAPESPMHTVHFLVLTEGRSEWTVSHHSTRYRAVGRRAISTAAQHAGFTQVTWHAGDDAGFHQPVMTSRVDG